MNNTPIIFLAFANHGQRHLPKLPDEYRELCKIWQKDIKGQKCYQLIDKPFVTLEDITQVFVNNPRDHIALFHFAGHGNRDVLLLEAPGGQTTIMDATRLARMLTNRAGLRLVFLNACYTREQVSALHNAGVPVVIATDLDIKDDVAVEFAKQFYLNLHNGYTIEIAFKFADDVVNAPRNPDGTYRHLRISAADDTQSDPPWKLYCSPEEAKNWRLEELLTTNSASKGNFLKPETIYIPAGPFLMGEGEEQHEVNLPAYEIGKYPVTNAEYGEFIKCNPQYPTPKKPYWPSRKPPTGKDRHPVVGVSWHDAQAYCDWLSEQTGRRYRLPSEAEWEKAVCWDQDHRRALRYPWGDTWFDDRCNVNNKEATPVDAYPKGASSFKCLDMLGNVQEWTSTEDRPEGQNKAEHLTRVNYIYRGGSYCNQVSNLHSSTRGDFYPTTKVSWLGFRVVKEIA